MAATISKSWNGYIEVLAGNMTVPAIFNDLSNASVSYGDNYVTLSIGNKGFKFSDDWGISQWGALTEVNGIDVSALTPAEIATIINNNVITTDRFSGTPTNIVNTTMVEGKFTAIHFIEDTIFDVSGGSATIEIDAEGNSLTMSSYSGKTFAAGDTIYGKWTQIKLVSGSVRAYSAL